MMVGGGGDSAHAVAQFEGLADDIGPGAEGCVPEWVRQDGDTRRTGLVVVGVVQATVQRLDAVQAEIRRRGAARADRDLVIELGTDQRVVARIDAGERLKRVELLDPVAEGGVRDADWSAATLLRYRPHSVGLVCWIRKGMNQDGVHHAKDGYIRADSDRQRHDDRRGEPGTTQ